MRVAALLIGACVLSACGPLVLEEARALGLRPEVPPASEDPAVARAQVELGRLLFWDPILSGDRDIACASCHHPDHGYADGRALAIGTGGHGLGPAREVGGGSLLSRNTPTVLDTAFNGLVQLGEPLKPERAPMFWDSRALSLEAQAAGPILEAGEMRGSLEIDEVFPEIVARLSAIDEYRRAFADAYGEDLEIDREHIVGAIAAFERSLITGPSSFDRFLDGDDSALDLQALRGLATFFDAGCGSCHSGPMFSDYELHDLGIGLPDDNGRRPLIRTPTLRNVARTAPYMHDGSIPTLVGAVDFYTGLDAALDPDLAANAPLGLGSSADVAHFLETLSDGSFDRQIPTAVPSRLPVGGAIE